MKPVFELDLCQPLSKLKGKLRPARHGNLCFPESAVDPGRGLEFPLQKGGLMYASEKIINDAAGSLEIVFSLKNPLAPGTLIQAWGQYRPLLCIDGHFRKLAFNVGEHQPLYLLVDWKADQEYSVRCSWDNRCGVTLSIRPKGGKVQVLRRRMNWRPFRQKYQPFAIGGMAVEPRYRRWTPSFQGWVKSVKVWDAPIEIPGPVAIAADGRKITAPFEAVDGVRVLEFKHDPIIPDPLKLDQLPDRLEDLKKTREVAELNDILGKCRDEVEIFTRLTSYVANLWPHCNYWPWPKNEQRHIFWKRGHEMLPQIRNGEMGGMCGGFAHVMEELFWAMGFDARRIQVSGHSSFEAYSNQYDRWVICDASYNRACHLFMDGDGTLLGCADLIRRIEELEWNPCAMDDVKIMNCVDENLVSMNEAGHSHYNFINHPAYLYDHIGLSVDKTAEYGKTASSCRTETRYAYYFRKSERQFFSIDRTLGTSAVLVDRLEELTPSRNRVDAEFSWKKTGQLLRIKLVPVGVTFFDCFRVEIDDQPPVNVKSVFNWQLHHGVNSISIRTVNKLGATGSPLSIKLFKKL